MLNGAGTIGVTVADETGGFVGPFVVEEVDGVFECARGGMVVFGGDKKVAVVLCNGCGPGFGVVVGVVAGGSQFWFVEDGEIERGDVDEGVGGVVALGCDVVCPLGDVSADASWAGAAGDNSDAWFRHASILACEGDNLEVGLIEWGYE